MKKQKGIYSFFLILFIFVILFFLKDKIFELIQSTKEQMIIEENYSTIFIIAALIIILIIVLIIIRKKNKKKQKNKIKEEKKLNKEIDEFWEKQELSIKMAKQKVISEAFKAHEHQLKQEQEKLKKQYQYGYRDNMTGYEYEQYCANLFRCYGWEAEVTPKSGDFGVDVIAKKNDIKIVVQCKKWNGSVGFNAVKEVFTGKTINKADYAIVITNSNFSQAAKKGAKDTGVILIKHSELEDCLNGLLKYENK